MSAIRNIRNIPGGMNLGGPIKELGHADDHDMIRKSREKLSRMCSPLLATAKRVGFEKNEAKTEYLVVYRIRRDDASLELDGYRYNNGTEFVHLWSSAAHDNFDFEINARIRRGSGCP